MDDTNEEERRLAAAIRFRDHKASNKNTKIRIKPCSIAENARQKYVLIEIQNGDRIERLVRGNQYAPYHMNVAEPTINELQECDIEYKVLGGGRIIHSSENQTIHVFGHSYGFPWEHDHFRHDLSSEVLKRDYPNFTVTTSDEGY